MVPPGMVIRQARLTGRPTLVSWAAEGVSVALCVAIDPGRRGDASAACAWLSDPKATANMVRTKTSFLYIDSVPRSSYQ